MRKCFTVLSLLLLLSSCGGGGADNSVPPRPADQFVHLNKGKFFGYFGDCLVDSCVPEFQGTVNLYLTSPWEESYVIVGKALEKAAGIPTILSLPDRLVFNDSCSSLIDAWLGNLSTYSRFTDVIYINLIDEPTLITRPRGVKSREALATAINCTTPLLIKYHLPVKFFAIYGCHHAWEGIELFDAVSCDDYAEGDAVLSHDIPRLKAMGKPVFLVSGGACDWNHDPRGMAEAVNKDPQLAGIIGFLYPNNVWAPGKCGIKNQPNRKYYDQLVIPSAVPSK